MDERLVFYSLSWSESHAKSTCTAVREFSTA
jgi:hypothetical protein